MFKFLHAADIHLDSPLKGLSRYEPMPVDEIRFASRHAFDRLIGLAIEEDVRFVLIAGDLYDGDWKDASTGLFFASRMGRLRERGSCLRKVYRKEVQCLHVLQSPRRFARESFLP